MSVSSLYISACPTCKIRREISGSPQIQYEDQIDGEWPWVCICPQRNWNRKSLRDYSSLA